MSKRRKQTRRGKRKSRSELYRARKTPTHFLVLRIRTPPLVRGGNPLGLGEYTLRIASPHRLLTMDGSLVC